MSPRTKKWLIGFLIIFAVYAIFRQPEQAANFVKSVIDLVVAVFSAAGRFFDGLLA